MKQTKKRGREKEREQRGGENHHKEQCDGIPETFAENDCIHSEPCYKKFALILAGQSVWQSKDRIIMEVCGRSTCLALSRCLQYLQKTTHTI